MGSEFDRNNTSGLGDIGLTFRDDSGSGNWNTMEGTSNHAKIWMRTETAMGEGGRMSAICTGREEEGEGRRENGEGEEEGDGEAQEEKERTSSSSWPKSRQRQSKIKPVARSPPASSGGR